MQILIGSSSVNGMHAVVASTAAEKAPWLTGLALVPEAPLGLTLSSDAAMLGSGTDELESLSLVITETPAALLRAPTGPVGEPQQFTDRLSIRAWEVAGALRVDFELPRLAAGDRSRMSGQWEEVPPNAHVLLVDTHIMGRAEMSITRLRFRYV
jgi:hypothetical protein